MEEWQRAFITSNLPELLTNTICHPEFLSILQSNSHIGKADLDKLKAVRDSDGESAQVKLMYELLLTRTSAFDTIIVALHETNQTGARNLLLYGYLREGTKIGRVQGRMISLTEFFRCVDSKTLKNLIETSMDTETVYKLTNSEEEFVLVINTIPKIENYYVPRTLTSRIQLSPQILKEHRPDIFVVKGITLNQLTKMVSPNMAQRSSTQLDVVNVRHIMCELDEDFHTICNKSSTGSNIHFLEFKNGSLNWLRSHGSIATLQDHVHEDQEKTDDYIFIENLLKDKSSQRPVCISDTPGMGKSVLLAKIANELNSIEDNKFVFFFVMREFVQYLPSNSKDITPLEIKKLVSSKVTTSKFVGGLLLHLLKSENHKLEICFDGLDEVLDTQIKNAKKLLTVIKDEFKNTRLHVTTRPHMRQALERTMGTLGYNILPFQEDDQITFLVKYWMQYLSKEPTERTPEILEEFAKLCLKTLKENMVENEEDIAGIPLQCRLLGEIYQARAERELSAQNTDGEALIRSIFQMYCKLMELRFVRAEQQQQIKDGKNCGSGKYVRLVTGGKPWVKTIKDVHISAAIDVLFPDFRDIFKPLLRVNHHKYLHKREIYDLGLIEAKDTFDSNYRFLHRTYAEFLVAEFLVEVLASKRSCRKTRANRRKILDFMFNKIFSTHTKSELIPHRIFHHIESNVIVNRFDNSVITYFINAHLASENVKPKSIYGPLLGKIPTIMNFEDILVSCAVSNFKNLFCFLKTWFDSADLYGFTLPQVIFIAAAKFSDMELNRILHKLLSNTSMVSITNRELIMENLVTLIHIIIQRGNHSIFQLFFKQYRLLATGSNILHACVIGSVNDTMYKICQKLDIMELILEAAPRRLNQKLRHDDSTPLLQPFSHLKLIRYLLEKDAQVNVVTKSRENVLHKILQRKDNEQIAEDVVIEAIMLLKEFGFFGYNVISSNQEVPLSVAMRASKLTKRSLTLFKSEGTRFTFVNKNQENLLFTAIYNQQPLECLQFMKMHGVDIQAVSKNKETLLHAATFVGHTQAVEYLVRVCPNLVNKQNVSRNTPLHIAFSKGIDNKQIQDILLEAGANILANNVQGYSPLEYGLIHSADLVVNVESLTRLKKFGFLLTNENSGKLLRAIFMNEHATWDLDTDFCDLIRQLILLGGRLNLNDNHEINTQNKNIHQSISRIAKKLNSTYLKVDGLVEPEEVFEMITEQVLNDRDCELVIDMISDKVTIEAIALILICLKDRESFRLLQKSYHLTTSNSLLFKDTRLDEFYHETNKKRLLIISDYASLTVAKLQEQIESSMPVLNISTFKNIRKNLHQDLVVVISETELKLVSPSDLVYPHKIIFILECFPGIELSVPKHLNLAIFRDTYEWQHLSRTLRSNLLLRFSSVESYENHYGTESLCLAAIKNPQTLPTSLLIPKNVQISLQGLFNTDNDMDIQSTTLHQSMQYHAATLLFPLIKQIVKPPETDLVNSGDVDQLMFNGPTASFLAALWILNNLSVMSTTLSEAIFECSCIETTIHHTKSSYGIITFEFKHSLVMYFLDKLILKSSVRLAPKVVISPHEEYEILHGCINLSTPNLTKLFRHKLCLEDDDMLFTAAKRGNASLFKSLIPQPTIEQLSKVNNRFQTSFSIAVCGQHLDDIAFFGDTITHFDEASKELCRHIFALCVDNTDELSLKVVVRRTLGLCILFQKRILQPLDISLFLENVHRVHPEIVEYLARGSY